MCGSLAVGMMSVLPFLAGPSAVSVPETRAATEDVVLVVAGDVPTPLNLTASKFGRLPRRTVEARDHEGRQDRFTGVPLVEVLKAAGVRFGEELRGPALESYLIVEAADGYRCVFALAELDPEFTDRVVLLADRRGDEPLDATEGPLRIVVPGEKRHSRWVRQVVALKVKKG